MSIRLSHPKHGFHVVYSETEVAEHAKHGWIKDIEIMRGSGNVFRDLGFADADERQAKAIDMIKEEDAIRSAYFAKFGKKPHHMAKLETIKKALDDNS